MKTLFTLLFCAILSAPLFAQTYIGDLAQTCGAYQNREATFENTPYVTTPVFLDLEWVYCGPWNDNDNGTFYMDIWIDDSWQDLFTVSSSGNGCSWVPTTRMVSASVWNSAIQSSDGSVLVRGYITDSCSPGVGCTSFNDPCFRGAVEYDYEPLEPAIAAFETNTSEVCQNEEFMLADLSTGSSLEYAWDYGVDAELGELVDGIQTISFSSPGTKTISLTVSNFQGESTHTFDMDVNPAPSISVSEDIELCLGTSATFEVFGEGSISWSDQLGSSASVEVAPTETQRYYVSLTNEFACVSEDSILYEVLDLPLVQAGVDASICRGESTLLSGEAEGEFSWSNDAEAGPEQLVSPEETSTYLLSSVGENGCVNSDEVLVTVNDIPEADAGQDLHLCIGESIELLASGGDTYEWDNELGEGEVHTVSPLESTSYIVNVGTLANCFNSDTVLVTVNPVPSIDVTESSSICYGETSTIAVIGEGDIDWSNDLGPQPSHDVSPEETTTYEVQLSNEFTCFVNASITITVHPPIETSLTGLSDTPYCSTDENAYNMIGSPAGGVYSGNGVEGNQFIPANAGIGALEITYLFEDEFGCEFSTTAIAEVDICDLISEQDLLFELYPNPIEDELLIAQEGESKKIVKVQVYGLNGQLVLEKEVQGEAMPIKLNCSSLESGNYVLHLIGEGWASNYSIIKE